MRESVHVKVVLRAAEIRGGAKPLSRALGVSLGEVQCWMRSEAPLPKQILEALLDTIIEYTLRDPVRPTQDEESLQG